MHLFRLTVFFILCSVIGGCLSTQNIAVNGDVSLKSNEGIVVIGLDEGTKGLFWMGNYGNGTFIPDGFFPKGFSLVSGESYMVQKAEITTETRRYGLQTIERGKDIFGFGCEQELPVLSLKAGEVQYFGDFSLLKNGSNLSVKHSFNIEKAQAFIDQHYPNKKWKLVTGDFVVAKKAACIQSISPIIIYIRI